MMYVIGGDLYDDTTLDFPFNIWEIYVIIVIKMIFLRPNTVPDMPRYYIEGGKSTLWGKVSGRRLLETKVLFCLEGTISYSSIGIQW